MKLIITLEDGQKTEGTVRSFSEYSHKDEKQFAGITMTYNVLLPVKHPMFEKLYVPDQFILEEINERNVLSFVIEVTRGLRYRKISLMIYQIMKKLLYTIHYRTARMHGVHLHMSQMIIQSLSATKLY